MDLASLTTPCALVDRARVERNTSRMSERMRALGVRMRPHVKTHKCVEAARLQVRGHFGGITVSTLAEAAFFAAAGFRDITYAFPLAIPAIARAAAVARAVEHLHVLVDQDVVVTALEAYAAEHAAAAANPHAARFSVFLKLDCGYHRAGVDPASPDAVRLAERLARSPAIDFRGVLAHAGHSYDCRDADAIRTVARSERDVTVAFAERLRRRGIAAPEVSIGSTPTMSLATDLAGVTEVRPGNYVFYDAFQAAIGSCTLEDAAFSVLTTIVGQYPEQNKLIVDAGALALSKDPGATHVDPDCGFGVVFTADGSRQLQELHVASLSQEHGQVHGSRPLRFGDYPVGSRLRIVPNHSCLAAALYDRYHVVDAGRVIQEWRPTHGW